MTPFFKSEAEIRTERLLLRPLRADDAEPIFALFNNWEVVRRLAVPPWPYTIEDARGYVRGAIDPPPHESEERLAITLDGGLIGGIGIRMRPASHLQREAGPNFGFWLGQPFWGLGYMTEAVQGLARQVFATRDAKVVYSGAFADNIGSLRVQAKVGFAWDGETMLYCRPRDADFPHVNTVLTRERFEARHS
jgi:RimJ/RimL family protein N-acetyltransferase